VKKSATTGLRNRKHAIQVFGARVTCRKLPTISGNYSQIVGLFQILIENAIAYSRDEPLEIVIQADCRENHVFSVQDNGMGIPEGQWQDVFELFTRSQAPPKTDRLGAGLGLARCIVEQHGGKIWLDSHVGEGSTFYLAIPGVKRV